MSSSAAFLSRVDHYIDDYRLLDPGQCVVVGISGGVDSIVLTHVLHRLGYDVVGAHVNYALRGEASDADEAFVRQWMDHASPPLPLEVARCDPKARAEATGESLQEAARHQRYAFFAECAAAYDTGRLAVAHHRDDQAETLLLNLFRGSALEGLGAMAPRRPIEPGRPIQVVRPLLGESRAAITTYAETNHLAWRTDASNAGLQYDRNMLRHRILPIIEEHFEGATDRMAAAADHVRKYLDETFDPALRARFDRCTTEEGRRGGALGVEALQDEPSAWRRRILLQALRQWLPGAPHTAAFAREIEALLDAQVGRRVDSGAGRVWRERNALRFVPSTAAAQRVDAQRVFFGTPTRLPHGTLHVDPVASVPAQLGKGARTEFIDAEAVEEPLRVRTWQEGDRFQPLGMKHTKLVSDLLTDERVPPHQRAEQLVVCDASRIVWVVGHRIAHPTRVRPDTEHVVRLHFEPTSVEIQSPLPSVRSD
jgi:tRNA(Ile)-lysidine synthase